MDHAHLHSQPCVVYTEDFNKIFARLFVSKFDRNENPANENFERTKIPIYILSVVLGSWIHMLTPLDRSPIYITLNINRGYLDL